MYRLGRDSRGARETRSEHLGISHDASFFLFFFFHATHGAPLGALSVNSLTIRSSGDHVTEPHGSLDWRVASMFFFFFRSIFLISIPRSLFVLVLSRHRTRVTDELRLSKAPRHVFSTLAASVFVDYHWPLECRRISHATETFTVCFIDEREHTFLLQRRFRT